MKQAEDPEVEFLNNIQEAPEVERKIQKKVSRIPMYLMIGLFLLVLGLSLFLWLFLLYLLLIRHATISKIVYDIPTLGMYHDRYTKFYNQYELNRDKLLASQTGLGMTPTVANQ